jgi:hypothetical protein
LWLSSPLSAKIVSWMNKKFMDDVPGQPPSKLPQLFYFSAASENRKLYRKFLIIAIIEKKYYLTVSSLPALFTSHVTIVAPISAILIAMSLPIPDPPPVTSTTSSLMVFVKAAG